MYVHMQETAAAIVPTAKFIIIISSIDENTPVKVERAETKIIKDTGLHGGR